MLTQVRDSFDVFVLKQATMFPDVAEKLYAAPRERWLDLHRGPVQDWVGAQRDVPPHPQPDLLRGREGPNTRNRQGKMPDSKRMT